MIAALFAAGLLLIAPANAFWRLPCSKPVLNSRVDPIINPGQPSAHSHTIMGSNAIGFSSTFQELRESTTCSTCSIKDDSSAYWTPQLMYQFKNGSFQVVDHGGMLVYYMQRTGINNNQSVEAFPDGLRMFTGNPFARSYSGTPEARAISWLCLNFKTAPVSQTPGFTNTNCPDGLRAQVFFPSCWDGVNLDSPDHKSHMAYPDGIDNGICPPTHPRRLVSIFYELWYSVKSFNDLNDGGRFVNSNGDPTGYGLHGDFLDGWDKSVLQRALDVCTNDDGVITDCPVFTNEGRFYDDKVLNTCSAPNPLPEDDTSDVILEYLPGCVAIAEGPADATPGVVDPACAAKNGAPAPAPPSASGSSGTPSVSSQLLLATGVSSVPSAPPTTASLSVASAATSAGASGSTTSDPAASSPAATSAGASSLATSDPAATSAPASGSATSDPAATSAAASGPVASSPASSSSVAPSPIASGTGNGNSSKHCASNPYRRDKTDAHRRSRMKRTHRLPLSK